MIREVLTKMLGIIFEKRLKICFKKVSDIQSKKSRERYLIFAEVTELFTGLLRLFNNYNSSSRFCEYLFDNPNILSRMEDEKKNACELSEKLIYCRYRRFD